MNDSPAKKLNFEPTGKENALTPVPLVLDPELLEKKETSPLRPGEGDKKVLTGMKALEADEPLLRENPGRFVLFPLKYHEVCSQPPRRRVTRKVVFFL